MAGINKALKHPKRFLRLLPLLTHQMLNFRSDLEKFRKNDSYQFGMHKDKFDHAASILLDTTFTSRIHNDPAFVADVDALEDWEDYEALTNYAEKQQGEDGLHAVHPYASDLLAFREKAMPGLKRKILMYSDFYSYINKLYSSLDMKHIPYDTSGNYCSHKKILQKTRSAFQWYSEKTRHLLQCT